MLERSLILSRGILLWVFVRREIAEQFAGTMLGRFWALAQPAFTVLLYWWVFGWVWAVRLPGVEGAAQPSFIVFLLSGMLPWLAFQDAVSRSAGALLARAEVLRHARFPAIVFPLARCLAAHAVFLPVLFGFFVFVAGEALLAQPLVAFGWLAWVGLQLIFACGLGLLLAALSVYLRDLPMLIGMGLQVLMFTAPILFPLKQMPDEVRPWLWLNPFTPLAEGYHQLILGGQMPEFGLWMHAGTVAAVAAVLGCWIFSRLRAGFADVL